MGEDTLDSTWSHLGWLSGGGERGPCRILELNSPGGHGAMREVAEVQGTAWAKGGQGAHGPFRLALEPGCRHAA